MLTLVIYDIPEDELRLKVAKFLKALGLTRVQKSAFLGSLTSWGRTELVAGLKRLVKNKKVNVQIYPLTQASFNMRICIGVELKYDEEENLIT